MTGVSNTRKLTIEILGNAKDATRAMLDVRSDSDKMGESLMKVGGIATGAGVALVGGLLWAAKESENAERQVRKLDNSIANSSQTFKENGKALKDLAADIQSKTAADADAIVGAQALMVQFGLTEAQVTSLTPLVVDLSQKMGVDLDTAAKAALKAVDGSSTSLKRMGINVDEAAFKLDPFNATVDTLRSTVGGFAEQEGATFSGQMERMKNQLGDIVEGVGGGAIEVFGGITDKVSGLVGATSAANPELANTVGKLGAIGGASLIAVGGLSTAAGWLLKMRDRFTSVSGEGDNAVRSLNGIGKAAAGIAAAGAAVGVVEGVFAVLNQSSGTAARAAAGLDKLKLALADAGSGAGDVVDAFGEMVGAEQDTLRLQNLWQEFGAEVSIVGTGVKADIEQVQRTFDTLGDTDGPEKQLAVLDALEKQTQSLDHSSDQYKTNMEFIERNRAAVEQHVAAVKADRRATDEMTGSTEDGTEATEDATSALQDYADQLRANTDPLFAVIDAQDRVADAKKRVDEAVTSGDLAAWRTATMDVTKSQFDLEGRMGALSTAVANGKVNIDQAKGAVDRLTSSGVITAQQAGVMKSQFDGVAWTTAVAGNRMDDTRSKAWWLGQEIGKPRSMFIDSSQAEQAIGAVQNRLAALRGMMMMQTWGLGGLIAPGRRAMGGPVTKGLPYIVGERGWELFVPDASGTVITHDDAVRAASSGVAPTGGAASSPVTVNVTFAGPVAADSISWVAEQVETAVAKGVRFPRLARSMA